MSVDNLKSANRLQIAILGAACLLCSLALLWLLLTVRNLNKEVAFLSDLYLDNQPWHMSQLQPELERLRYSLNELRRNPNSEQWQQQASLHLELVWNRVDVLIEIHVKELTAVEQGEILGFLDQILLTFAEYEDSLYALSDAQVQELWELTTQWNQKYQSQVVDIFQASYQAYEEMSQHVISTYRSLRTQLISFFIVMLFLLFTTAAIAQRARQLAKKEKQASAAKTEFLANMSHELRTPLNGIIGTIEMMRLEQNHREDWLTTLSASSEALLAQINDVLDFSRIESGTVLVEQQEVDLRLLTTQIEAVMRQLADNKGVGLKTRLPEKEVNCWVTGDPVKIRQVLLNLVGNAIKFTHHGEVQLELSQNSSHDWQWRIIDTGIGIPAARLKNIFEPFQQAEGNTSRHYGGTGLGLAITHQLIDLMGGVISVDSKPGSGSSFTVRLPLHSLSTVQAEPDSERSDVSEAHFPGVHVLLVEDNPVNMKVADALLRSLGITVHTAESGEACLNQVGTTGFDLILMDIQMPGMDGYACTRKLRASGVQVPIIALTANSSEDVRMEAMASGMNDFISKPFRRVQLIQRLSVHLQANLMTGAISHGTAVSDESLK